MMRQQVLLGVNSKLALEAEVCFTQVVEPWVRGPQFSKHLAHGSEPWLNFGLVLQKVEGGRQGWRCGLKKV
eukprot:1641985-Ditylum_brightwellii.AAC.1